MKFKTITGRIKSIRNAKKYRIDWEGESKSNIQKAVKLFLKKYWEKHIVFEEFPVAGTRLSLDFYNANKKIAIEVQGAQHTKHVPFFHGKNKYNFVNQLRRDQEKLNYCEINEIILIEVYDEKELNPCYFKNNGVIL